MVPASTSSKVKNSILGITRRTKQVYTQLSHLDPLCSSKWWNWHQDPWNIIAQSLDPLNSPWCFFQHRMSHHSLPSRSESWPAGALILWFPLGSSCWYPSTHRKPHSSYPNWKNHASGSSSCPDVYDWHLVDRCDWNSDLAQQMPSKTRVRAWIVTQTSFCFPFRPHHKQ